MSQPSLFAAEELKPCSECVYEGESEVCAACRALPCNRAGCWFDKRSKKGREFIRLRERRRQGLSGAEPGRAGVCETLNPARASKREGKR